MLETILQAHQPSFEKVMDRFTHELNSVRTGRASAGLLSTVMVESYGVKTPLEHVASIATADAKTLVITPWDKSTIQPIEKGIQEANLGLNPSNDGQVLRITIPPMSEDRRREMVKLLGTMSEQARIGIRQVREDALKDMKQEKSDGTMREDDFANAQKKLQDVVDKYNAQVKELTEVKEKEIMTV